MHEEYLKSVNFNGNYREEIAKRLGISVPQADRYNTMNKIVLPVWDMVRAEIVGISSVQPMASHSEDEQMEIYNILQDALKNDVTLTRDTVKMIVDNYRDGKKTWAEIANLPRDSGIPLNAYMNTEPGVTREPSATNRNDEVRRDYDPIAAEYDRMDEEAAQREQDRQDDEEQEQKDKEPKEEKPVLTEEEKQIKLGEEIGKQLHKLDTNIGNVWKCENAEQTREMIMNMNSLAQSLIDEMYRLSQEWDMNEEWERAIADVDGAVKQYN